MRNTWAGVIAGHVVGCSTPFSSSCMCWFVLFRACAGRAPREMVDTQACGQLLDVHKEVKTHPESAITLSRSVTCSKRCMQAQRLFRDRLADPDSEKRFNGMLDAQFRSSWGHTAELTGVSEFQRRPNTFKAGEASRLSCSKRKPKRRENLHTVVPGNTIPTLNENMNQGHERGLYPDFHCRV